MVTWLVELSYGLQYESRGKLSAHALVDFVVKLTPYLNKKVNTQGTLFVDGSTNGKGSGAEVTLEEPRDLTLEQSLRLEFHASNNEAGYEALNARLKLAIEVKIESLLIHSWWRTRSQELIK